MRAWADAVVVPGGAEAVDEVRSFVRRRRGGRERPGDRVAVVGRVAADVDVAASDVAAVRDAGADGCLVGLPAPWSAEPLERLRPVW